MRTRAKDTPPAGSSATAARRAAVRILESCRAGRIFEHALEDATRSLDERDRRLAHEIAAGVLRRQSALDAMLSPLVTRDWSVVPEPLRQILRAGAYQLTALERVPVHAAVDTSVSLARESSGARAAGFVNAVLRKLSAQMSRSDATDTDASGVGSSDIAERPEGGEFREVVSRLAAQFSHPEWLVERWIQRFGAEETTSLLRWNDTRPRLAVQAARVPLDQLLEQWRHQGHEVEAAPFGQGVYVDARRPDQLAGFETGDFLVQDPAQALVARFASAPGVLMYDACAAPGGKSLAMAHRGARVVAADISRLRIQRVRENTARAGSGRELVMVADALHPPLRPVDAVLLDAPCLGTGTFARHPDARWRVTPGALEGLAIQQRNMMDALALQVRPGGMLVYATCSLEPEENECQVDAFLTRHPSFRREPNPDIPPELATPGGDLVILPQRHRMDGAYAARLRRNAH
ncbi:MAG: transcription antitermination factor NusB [Gemmatimonadota bacterium]